MTDRTKRRLSCGTRRIFRSCQLGRRSSPGTYRKCVLGDVNRFDTAILPVSEYLISLRKLSGEKRRTT